MTKLVNVFYFQIQMVYFNIINSDQFNLVGHVDGDWLFSMIKYNIEQCFSFEQQIFKFWRYLNHVIVLCLVKTTLFWSLNLANCK